LGKFWNSLNTNRYGANGGGIQTAAIAVGGNQGGGTFPVSKVTEEYDGTIGHQEEFTNSNRFLYRFWEHKLQD
jgi:hypothetical protein